ncbi:MAG: hypothetical protein U0990_08685 [Candidatus Nanopelagicales bacterium]|nr:hypothetical protein [Candidatus Nanopelagicales bacterium]MDZ4250152.1 hypothetical protein [Candidatus Nanopelagicales bacterium]
MSSERPFVTGAPQDTGLGDTQRTRAQARTDDPQDRPGPTGTDRRMNSLDKDNA